MKTKLGIVGFGNIAREHIKACQHNKIEIDFIIRNSIDGNYQNIPIYTWESFPGFNKNISGLICATPPKISRDLLKNLIPDNIPTLYEKPLFEDIQDFNNFLGSCSLERYQNTYIAFNRRHYKTVKKLRELVSKSDKFYLEGSFSDRFLGIQKSKKIKAWNIPMYISSHWIDMIGAIIGYEILDKLQVESESSYHLTFSNNNKEKCIRISFTPNQVRNHSIRFISSNEEYHLKPLEKLNQIAFKIITSNTNNYSATKKYMIQSNPIIEENKKLNVKPGFSEQVLWFIEQTNNNVQNLNLIKKKYYRNLEIVFSKVYLIQKWSTSITIT